MKITINRHILVAFLVVLLAVFNSLILLKVTNKEALFVDEYMKGHLQPLQGEGSLAFFSVITEMGSEVGIVATVMASLLWMGRKKMYAAMAVYPLAIISTHIVNKTLKEIVARERPSLNEALDALGYSFPSGHAMLSVVTYGFLACMIAGSQIGKTVKVLAAFISALLIILVGLSRVVLSVHYPSDVLGGYAMGGILLVAALYAYTYAQGLQQHKQEMARKRA
ncbi:MAG: phosphatase PAP2 family protein [Ectobacillus sp.]